MSADRQARSRSKPTASSPYERCRCAVDGLRVLPTQHTVADVLRRVQTLARARGLTVFAQIDFSGDAERSGLELRPTGLVILGNPKAGTPLMLLHPRWRSICRSRY
jgi:hypothetical protein